MPFNIELPDGRIIEGIPDGTTKAQIASKFNLPFNQPSKLESVARGAYQGLSVGLGDELAGIGGGIIVGTAADLYYGNGFNPVKNYQAATESARGQNKAAQEANPWTYGLSEIAGSIPTTAKAIASLPLKYITANTVLGSADKAAGVGAGVGGAYGYGLGEGLQGSLESAGVGAVLGGVTGGILDAGISKYTGRYKPTVTTSPILSEQGVIPLTRGQLTGEDALLQKEMDLRKLKNPSGQLLQGFENQIQKPAALNYLKKQFNMPETSYQNLMGELQSGIQSKAGQVKQAAVNLRQQAEKGLTSTLPKQFGDDLLNEIDNSLSSFGASDAEQTINMVKQNVFRTNRGGNSSNINPATPQDVEYLSQLDNLKASITTAAKKPKTISNRVRELGGITDRGDLENRGLQVGIINNAKGRSPDDMASVLQQEGYFYHTNNTAGVDDLINALDDEAQGVNYFTRSEDADRLYQYLNQEDNMNNIINAAENLGINTTGSNRKVLASRIENSKNEFIKSKNIQSQDIKLQNIFNAKKDLQDLRKGSGAKSAAAAQADALIDKKLNDYIEQGIISGDTETINAYKKSVPAFRKFYQNYENSPSSVFNKVATNPEALSPDELFNTIYGKSLGGSTSGRLFAEQVKKTLGEGVNEKLQQGFIDALVKKSTNDLGEVNLNTMKSQLNNFLSNQQFAKTIMPDDKLIALKNLRVDLAKATRSPQGYKDSGTAYNMERLKGLLGFGGIKGDILKSIVNRTENVKQLKFAKDAVNTQQLQAAPMQNIYGNTLGVTARPATANVQEILNR